MFHSQWVLNIWILQITFITNLNHHALRHMHGLLYLLFKKLLPLNVIRIPLISSPLISILLSYWHVTWHYFWWIIWIQINLTLWVVRYRRPFLWPLNSGWLFPSNPNSTSSQYNKILQKKQDNVTNLLRLNVSKTPCLKDNNKLKSYKSV